MKHQFKLELDKIILNPLSNNDIEMLRMWRNDPKNTKYLRKIPYITKEMQMNWYKNYLANEDEICFSIYSKDLKRVVGSISLYNIHQNDVELGKLLIGDPEAHGKKLGYYSVIGCIKIAKDYLSKSKIVLHVFEDNKGAVKIYKDAGFVVVSQENRDGMNEYLMECV